jgi:hypothetical protein
VVAFPLVKTGIRHGIISVIVILIFFPLGPFCHTTVAVARRLVNLTESSTVRQQNHPPSILDRSF